MSPLSHSDFKFVERHVILDYDEYWFEVDEYRQGDKQFLLAHIFFERFSPSIYKRVLREWRAFRQCVPAPLYAISNHDGDEKTWVHFVSSLGFKPTGLKVLCNNGAERQLFISTVSHEHL